MPNHNEYNNQAYDLLHSLSTQVHDALLLPLAGDDVQELTLGYLEQEASVVSGDVTFGNIALEPSARLNHPWLRMCFRQGELAELVYVDVARTRGISTNRVSQQKITPDFAQTLQVHSYASWLQGKDGPVEHLRERRYPFLTVLAKEIDAFVRYALKEDAYSAVVYSVGSLVIEDIARAHADNDS